VEQVQQIIGEFLVVFLLLVLELLGILVQVQAEGERVLLEETELVAEAAVELMMAQRLELQLEMAEVVLQEAVVVVILQVTQL
jgi:hypothetical protein